VGPDPQKSLYTRGYAAKDLAWRKHRTAGCTGSVTAVALLCCAKSSWLARALKEFARPFELDKKFPAFKALFEFDGRPPDRRRRRRKAPPEEIAKGCALGSGKGHTRKFLMIRADLTAARTTAEVSIDATADRRIHERLELPPEIRAELILFAWRSRHPPTT